MNIRGIFLISVGIFLVVNRAVAQAPQLTATAPTFWAIGVSPTVQKTISLTFDQPMRPGFSSWLGRSTVAPSSDAKPIFSDDHLMYSLPTQLQPGKVYVFALNEKNIPGVGFQNEKGLNLPPTFLVFQTAGTLAPDDTSPRALATNPPNGTQKIDAGRTKTVSVTFDKAMQVAKHGMHIRENQKEVDLSKARFQYTADGKGFTLAYDFKPKSSYEFELNNVHDIGFASVKRIPLWPVKFAFSTQ